VGWGGVGWGGVGWGGVGGNGEWEDARLQLLHAGGGRTTGGGRGGERGVCMHAQWLMVAVADPHSQLQLKCARGGQPGWKAAGGVSPLMGCRQGVFQGRCIASGASEAILEKRGASRARLGLDRLPGMASLVHALARGLGGVVARVACPGSPQGRACLGGPSRLAVGAALIPDWRPSQSRRHVARVASRPPGLPPPPPPSTTIPSSSPPHPHPTTRTPRRPQDNVFGNLTEAAGISRESVLKQVGARMHARKHTPPHPVVCTCVRVREPEVRLN
jgi:hypothetical protein